MQVEDALMYLEQVKQQLGDRPDVYSQFLDIMKDFKAQVYVRPVEHCTTICVSCSAHHRLMSLCCLHSVDIPGVIDRVVRLFKDDLHLIRGFSVFVPQAFVHLLPSQ